MNKCFICGRRFFAARSTIERCLACRARNKKQKAKIYNKKYRDRKKMEDKEERKKHCKENHENGAHDFAALDDFFICRFCSFVVNDI